MANFIRHPIDIPLEYRLEGDGHAGGATGTHCGGLCFETEQPIRPGCMLHISIPVREQPFEANGVVEWCHPNGGRFEIGLGFRDEETGYRMRMAEQVCRIELYRREHRELSGDDAAREWISRFAADFPTLPSC